MLKDHNALVSVIIPCYNAERWVREAIQSSLDQTYRPIEVIVIDDGSTDKSLEVIKSFGDKIRWETGPNRGGNAARNWGFALSKGEYIQFLDADDYLLPSKVERQIKFFQRITGDIVYEDWQQFRENADGTKVWFPVRKSGEHSDILRSLLGNWIAALQAFLFTKRVLKQVSGWDEELTSAQDWELHIRLALSGAVYRYLPGCQSAVRRPMTVTVHTRNGNELNENVVKILKRTELILSNSQKLTTQYKDAMALNYFFRGRGFYAHDRSRFNELVQEARRLSKSFTKGQTGSYRAAALLLGVNAAERLAGFTRRFRLTK